MRDLFTEEKVLLKRLSKRWSIDLFEIYKTENLSLAQIAQFVRLYEEKGYIRRIRYRIIKTFRGHIMIKLIVPELYRMANTSWKEVPKVFLKKPIKLSTVYKNVKFKYIE